MPKKQSLDESSDEVMSASEFVDSVDESSDEDMSAFVRKHDALSDSELEEMLENEYLHMLEQ